MSTFDVTTLVARTAVSFTVPYDALGIVLGVFVVVLGCALSALFTRLWFSKYQSEFAKDDAAIVTQLTGVNVLGLSLVVPAIPTALVDTATSIGDTIPRLDTLAISFAIYMVCMVVIAYHPTLAETAVRIQQCNVQPVLTGLVFHLANFVRLLYNALWPIVSLGYGYFVLISRGHIKVLRACAIGTFDIHAIFNHLADIGQAVVDSLIAYLGGDIFHDPIPLTNVFAQIGHTSNALVPALMCYCAWFEPLIVLVTSIPQITALHVTADAVVNAALRLLQLLLNALITWSPPVWDEFANELITAVTAVGSLLRDALILVIDYLTDLLHQIELLSASRPAAIEALFGLDDAMPPPPPQMAASTTKAMPPSGKEEVLEEETDDNNNNNTTFSSQQARAPAFTSADLFHVVANTPRSRSRWAVGSGKHRVELGTAATAGPRARLSAMRDDYDVVVNAPIWELPPGMDLADLLGLPVLITVLETPWPRAVTELAAAAIVLGNMTLNMICNPVALVQGPSAIAYFQFGPVFDHIRASGDAASQLLVFVDPNLPAVVSLLAQAAVTLAEAVMELFVGTLNAIVYPTWSFGEPPPTDCSAPGACTYPAPIGWTILFIYPDYYDWSNSALRRALRTLEYMADATLVMLGRDSTDTHQEHCAKKPVACTFYDTLLVATEAVNLTLTFLFYFPELVLFDDDRRTFQNIDLSRIHDRFYDLVEHISAWYALALFLLLRTHCDSEHDESENTEEERRRGQGRRTVTVVTATATATATRREIRLIRRGVKGLAVLDGFLYSGATHVGTVGEEEGWLTIQDMACANGMACHGDINQPLVRLVGRQLSRVDIERICCLVANTANNRARIEPNAAIGLAHEECLGRLAWEFVHKAIVHDVGALCRDDQEQGRQQCCNNGHNSCHATDGVTRREK